MDVLGCKALYQGHPTRQWSTHAPWIGTVSFLNQLQGFLRTTRFCFKRKHGPIMSCEFTRKNKDRSDYLPKHRPHHPEVTLLTVKQTDYRNEKFIQIIQTWHLGWRPDVFCGKLHHETRHCSNAVAIYRNGSHQSHFPNQKLCSNSAWLCYCPGGLRHFPPLFSSWKMEVVSRLFRISWHKPQVPMFQNTVVWI